MSGKLEKEIEERNLNLVFVLVVVAVVLACLADALTVYIFCSFKKLEKHHQNICIFHNSVLNLINFPITVLALVAINYEYITKRHDAPSMQRSGFLLNLLVDVIASIVFAQISLMTFMTIDWYMFTFVPQISATFRKFTKTIIISTYLYALSFTLYSIVVFLWHDYPRFLSAFFIFGNLMFFLILYLVFGTIYLCRRKSLPKANAIPLKISLIRVLTWLCLIISFLTSLITYNNKIMNIIASCFKLLVVLSPVTQLILLYFWDRNYEAALSRTFCCRVIYETESGQNG